VDELGQRLLVVVRSEQRPAVAALDRGEGAPFVDDEVEPGLGRGERREA